MSKVPPILVDPEKPESIVKAVTEVTRVVDSEIEFGSPQNPYDDQSTTLAGSGTPTTHNGSVQNIKGQWVEVEIGASEIGTAVTCTHNLEQTVVNAAQPNVRWFVAGVQHDGDLAERWEDLRVSPNMTRVAAQAPTFGNGTAAPFAADIQMWYFATAPGGGNEGLYFNVQMPHNYLVGSDISPHVHWVPDIAAVADEAVKWDLIYEWENIEGTFSGVSTVNNDATDETSATTTGERLVQNKHYISDMSNITGTGMTSSSMLACKLERDTDDALDDYAGDAGLLEIDFHYQVDTRGSDAEFTKTSAIGGWDRLVSVFYDTDSTVAANSIPLTFCASESLLVNDSHKIKVTLFFIPAVR